MFPIKKSPKISKIFLCENCNYKCSKNSEFNKHILTNKHKILQNPTSYINNNKTSLIRPIQRAARRLPARNKSPATPRLTCARARPCLRRISSSPPARHARARPPPDRRLRSGTGVVLALACRCLRQGSPPVQPTHWVVPGNQAPPRR